MFEPISLDDRARTRIGTMLRGDKYRLDALLGVGAMGAVYAATHRNGGRVAVKLLHKEHAQDEIVKRRFLREGYIANKVNHPGIVRIIDDDVDDDGTTFLVMDLLEGRTLGAEWLDYQKKMPVARVGELMLSLLDILAAVHAEGIVHRDVKPDNLFVTRQGRLMLLDLGIARLVESRTLTANGTMMGTPEFAAPEQAAGEISLIDSRTDLFSVGAMMFAMLSGRFVHEGRSAMEIMVRAGTIPARSIFDVMPELPPLLANVIDVALMFEKTQRWSSALDMKRALATTLDSLRASGRMPASAPALPRDVPPAAVPPAAASEPALASTKTLVHGAMDIARQSEGSLPSAPKRKG
jgi:serine/threonine-protein kinase